MSKGATRGRVKNPCRICNQTVVHKSGIQCKGACARWAHYKCLGYSHQKILNIKDGVIKITCPCPHCSPKVPVEEVVKPGRRLSDFFPEYRRGEVPCPPDGSCQSPRRKSPCQGPGRSPCQSPPRRLSPSGPPPRKASPRQHSPPAAPYQSSCQPQRESPSQSPRRRLSPSDLKNSPCPGPPSRETSQCIPMTPLIHPPIISTEKKPPCPVEKKCRHAPRTMSPRLLPARKQYLYQPYVRKQTACQPIHGKPPCQKPGELQAPCQPTEEVSIFQRVSPKRSCIQPKDDFAFNPTSFEPQLFQPSAFKADPPPCDLSTCDPLCVPPLFNPATYKPPPCDPPCIPPQEFVPPCDTVQCRNPSPKNPTLVPCHPSPKGGPDRKNITDCKTPPLSRTPSKISLVSPKVSPKQSKEAFQSPSASTSTRKSSSASASSQKSPSASPHASPCQTNKCNKTNRSPIPIFPRSSITKCHRSCRTSPTSSFSDRPCKKSAPCRAPPPDTSLSCCIKCKNCKCSSRLSLIKSNCISPICPKKARAKSPPRAPPPTPAPKSGVTCCSKKKPCVNCTSSICPNQRLSMRNVETCTEKKSKSCACLTILRETSIRPTVSDSKIANTCQTMLFSAIDQLCTTMGQLSGQIRMLMSRING